MAYKFINGKPVFSHSEALQKFPTDNEVCQDITFFHTLLEAERQKISFYLSIEEKITRFLGYETVFIQNQDLFLMSGFFDRFLNRADPVYVGYIPSQFIFSTPLKELFFLLTDDNFDEEINSKSYMQDLFRQHLAHYPIDYFYACIEELLQDKPGVLYQIKNFINFLNSPAEEKSSSSFFDALSDNPFFNTESPTLALSPYNGAHERSSIDHDNLVNFDPLSALLQEETEPHFPNFNSNLYHGELSLNSTPEFLPLFRPNSPPIPLLDLDAALQEETPIREQQSPEMAAVGGIRASYFDDIFSTNTALPIRQNATKNNTDKIPKNVLTEEKPLCYRLQFLKDVSGACSEINVKEHEYISIESTSTDEQYQYHFFWKKRQIRYVFAEDNIRESQVTFVMSARLGDALVPTVSQDNSRIFLILTESEFNKIKNLPGINHFDCLILQRIGSYNNLSLLNCRRLAAWITAEHLNLSDFMMIDDNIKLIQYKPTETFNIRSEPSWEDIYENIKISSKQKKIACLSVFNENKKHKEESESHLGSKVFFFDWCTISANLNLKKGGVFNLSYTPIQSEKKYWGEDYFFQIYLKKLFYSMNTKAGYAYSITDRDIMRFYRKKHIKKVSTLDISCKVVGIQAKLLNLSPEEAYFPPHEIDHIRSETLRELNLIIAKNKVAHEKKYQKIRDADLSSSHKRANPQHKLVTHKFFELRTHQKEALNKIQDNILEQNSLQKSGNGYIELFTGSGKTLIQIELSRWMIDNFEYGNVIVIEPTLDLVNQYYERFLETLPKDDKLRERIIKISSNEQDVHSSVLFINQSLKHQKNVYIFCEKSFSALLRTFPDIIPLSECSLLILDEFHKYSSEKSATVIRDWFIEKNVHCYGFTATVPPNNLIFPNQKPLISFDLYYGIEKSICTPVIIDSLTWAYTDDLTSLQRSIYALLNECTHPNGGGLLDKKGIIFLPNISEIRTIKALLCQNGYPEDRIFEVHYQEDKNLRHDGLSQFKQISCYEQGIILASRMLRLGFDDPGLSWILNFQKSEEPNNFLQILGRVVRKNAYYPNKIGYLIKLNYAVNFTEKNQTPKVFQLDNKYTPLFSGYFSDGQALSQQVDPSFLDRNLTSEGNLYIDNKINAKNRSLSVTPFYALGNRKKEVCFMEIRSKPVSKRKASVDLPQEEQPANKSQKNNAGNATKTTFPSIG
jgi:superfamily II DNA or RNA helicase